MHNFAGTYFAVAQQQLGMRVIQQIKCIVTPGAGVSLVMYNAGSFLGTDNMPNDEPAVHVRKSSRPCILFGPLVYGVFVCERVTQLLADFKTVGLDSLLSTDLMWK